MNTYLQVLLAAMTLPGQFSRQDLAVAAWRLYPAQFGLSDYALPHCQRCYCKLYGINGLSLIHI